MPPRRKFRRKRRYPRKKRSTVAYKANVAYRMAKKLNSQVEQKYFLSQSASAIPSTGSITRLNQVPQGDQDIHRNGDNLRMKGLTIRGHVKINGAATYTQLRAIVFFDPQVKVDTTVDNLLNTTYTGTGQACLAPKDHDKRFWSKVLWDRTFTLNQADKTAISFKKYIPVNKHTQFEAGGTTINAGQLSLLLISNEATNTPTFSYISQLSYTDA